MKIFIRSLVGFLVGGFIGSFCMIPFAYGLAHGSGGIFVFIPLLVAIISMVSAYFSKTYSIWLKYWGIFFGLIVFSYFVLPSLGEGINKLFPLLDRMYNTFRVEFIVPKEIQYQPVYWSGKTIGVTVQAKFSMNPDLSELGTQDFPLAKLPTVSFNQFGYSERHSQKIDGIFMFSGTFLLSPIQYRNNEYCISILEDVSTIDYPRGSFSGYLLYPYIEGVCHFGLKCFTSYDIPGSEFILDIDPGVFAELPICKI